MPNDKKAKVRAKLKKKRAKKKKPTKTGDEARRDNTYNEWVDDKYPGYALPSSPLNPYK